MLKKLSEWAAKKPIIFNLLRRIIEFNYIAIKRTIRKELSLGQNMNASNVKKGSIQRVLDIACGTGEFCMLFDPLSYYGIDISQKYINYAWEKYKRNFFCRDAEKNGFEDSYFNKVLILGLLHHLDDVSVEVVLKETKRVLKKDGKMLLIEDAPTSLKWNIVGRFLQSYDIGENIRDYTTYKKVLEKYFMISRYYPIKSGFWDYSVFILFPKLENNV